MRYKAEYKPSELRCPVTGAWVPVEECRARWTPGAEGSGRYATRRKRGFPGRCREAKGNSKSRLRRKERRVRRRRPRFRRRERRFQRLLRRSRGRGVEWRFAVRRGLTRGAEELRALQPLLREKHERFRKATGCAGEGLACLVDADRVQASEGWGLSDPETSESERDVGDGGGERGGERERVTRRRTKTRDAFGVLS